MQVNIRLNKNFTTAFNRMQEKYGEEFSKLNGFADEQLSYTDFIDNFIDSETVADASVDGNANVGNKDMRTLMNEMPKPHRKLLAYNKIYYELNKKYGFKTANEWLEKEWTKALYMHDADTSTFIPYCFAYDLKDLAEKGLFFLNNFNAEPPKHLSTFIDFVKEFISFNSNRTSGACGLPNLIPYIYYFWKKDCEEGYATKSPDYYARQQIQRFVYAINQPYVRDGMQSAFTNVSVFDGPYLEALFGGAKFPDGSYMIDELDEIKEFQKLFMEETSEIRSHNMMTFPVLTISLLRENGKFADEEFAQWGIKHNMKWADSNLFIDKSVTSLSNCCRLKSNIDDLGYFNSIGGTALKVGSVKVSTVNLARLALENNTEQDYLIALKELVELDCKVLDVVRHIIERNVEKGLLPNFSKGLIDFEHLYSTVGVIGVYETMKTFGYTKQDEFGNTYYTDEAMSFGERIFKVIHQTKDQFALDKDYKINLEQVPGETAANKMQQADTLLYPETVVDDLPLYGNQFIPLGIKTSIQERVRIASTFDSYCNGGSIAHINIESPFDTFEKAWQLTEWIADQGLTYFAFNVKIQACKHNHAFFGSVCPECGGPVETEYTRIVGFYTPIKTWSKNRKAEYKLREWEKVNE
jgi:ribonucleoside-triphosphate reductase